MKYRVGEKVRARKDIADGDLVEYYGGLEKYAGQILTIAGVFPNDEQYIVEEAEEGGCYHCWTDDMLEPVNPKKAVDNVLEQLCDELDEYKEKFHEALYSDLDNISQAKQPEKKTTSKYRDISMKELASLEIGLDTGESSDPDDPRGLDWFPVFVKGPKGYHAQFFDEFENTDDQHPLRIEAQDD